MLGLLGGMIPIYTALYRPLVSDLWRPRGNGSSMRTRVRGEHRWWFSYISSCIYLYLNNGEWDNLIVIKIGE